MIDPLKSYPPEGFGLFRKKEPVLSQQQNADLSSEGAEASQARPFFRGIGFAGHTVLGMVKAASVRLGLHRVTQASSSLPDRKRRSARS
jgi:hypothetical protein